MEYCQEGTTSTAAPPTPTSDVVSQHNKIKDITSEGWSTLHTILNHKVSDIPVMASSSNTFVCVL